jgi:hypothetical protein
MTADLIVILPLPPGKQAAWRQLCQILQGSRRQEYAGCLQRIRVARQAVWLLQIRQIDLVQHHLRVEQCEQMVTALATSAHPFDRWLRKQLFGLHGLDLTQFARTAHELMLAWPPAGIEAVVIDEQKQHEYYSVLRKD